MARNKKNILNQVVEEPKVEVKSEGLIFEEPKFEFGEDYVNDPSIERTLVEKSLFEISLKDSGEKLAELKEKESLISEEDEEEVEEKVIEETPRPAGIRSLDKDVLKRLTHRERRFFQRTGILPK